MTLQAHILICNLGVGTFSFVQFKVTQSGQQFIYSRYFAHIKENKEYLQPQGHDCILRRKGIREIFNEKMI